MKEGKEVSPLHPPLLPFYASHQTAEPIGRDAMLQQQLETEGDVGVSDGVHERFHGTSTIWRCCFCVATLTTVIPRALRRSALKPASRSTSTAWALPPTTAMCKGNKDESGPSRCFTSSRRPRISLASKR